MEFAEYRFPNACRQSFNHASHYAAQTITFNLCLFNGRYHLLCCISMPAANGVALNFFGCGCRRTNGCLDLPYLINPSANRNALLFQILRRQGSGSNPTRSNSSTASSATAMVPVLILVVLKPISVARPIHILQRIVILGTRIVVGDNQCDG